ncbi:MAG: OadG family protein [bacterium]
MNKSVPVFLLLLFLNSTVYGVTGEKSLIKDSSAKSLEKKQLCETPDEVRCHDNNWEKCLSGVWTECDDCAEKDSWCVANQIMSDREVKYYIPAIGILIVLLVQTLLALIFSQFRHLTPSTDKKPEISLSKKSDKSGGDKNAVPEPPDLQKIAAITAALNIYMSGIEEEFDLTEDEDISDESWKAAHRMSQISNYKQWKSHMKRMR